MPNAARIPVARCKAEKVAIKGNSANSSMETVCATFKEK